MRTTIINAILVASFITPAMPANAKFHWPSANIKSFVMLKTMNKCNAGMELPSDLSKMTNSAQEAFYRNAINQMQSKEKSLRIKMGQPTGETKNIQRGHLLRVNKNLTYNGDAGTIFANWEYEIEQFELVFLSMQNYQKRNKILQTYRNVLKERPSEFKLNIFKAEMEKYGEVTDALEAVSSAKNASGKETIFDFINVLERDYSALYSKKWDYFKNNYDNYVGFRRHLAKVANSSAQGSTNTKLARYVRTSSKTNKKITEIADKAVKAKPTTRRKRPTTRATKAKEAAESTKKGGKIKPEEDGKPNIKPTAKPTPRPPQDVLDRSILTKQELEAYVNRAKGIDSAIGISSEDITLYKYLLAEQLEDWNKIRIKEPHKAFNPRPTLKAIESFYGESLKLKYEVWKVRLERQYNVWFEYLATQTQVMTVGSQVASKVLPKSLYPALMRLRKSAEKINLSNRHKSYVDLYMRFDSLVNTPSKKLEIFMSYAGDDFQGFATYFFARSDTILERGILLKQVKKIDIANGFKKGDLLLDFKKAQKTAKALGKIPAYRNTNLNKQLRISVQQLVIIFMAFQLRDGEAKLLMKGWDFSTETVQKAISLFERHQNGENLPMEELGELKEDLEAQADQMEALEVINDVLEQVNPEDPEEEDPEAEATAREGEGEDAIVEENGDEESISQEEGEEEGERRRRPTRR